MTATHDVLNQPAPLCGHNLFDTHRALVDAVRFHAPGLSTAALSAFGAVCGTADMQAHARLANFHPPQLHTHDRQGRRIDTVEFHPSYHALMALAVGEGLHGTPWSEAGIDRHGHVRRAAGFIVNTELEPSMLCPISMTYAVTPALQGNAAIAREWAERLTSRRYDGRFVPAAQKTGVTMGMGMTEKQGGSDVRANTTRALPDGTDAWGERYRLTGHKWFFSAPMSDAFLVLAQAPGGLSCFFLPRFSPDGSINAIRIQRLKDKLGNKANASSEVEFEEALAWRIGDEGRGIPQILEMGALTRLDCALGSAGLMRGALALALHHCEQRQAFGKPLISQALMRNVLADLALESEAATALAMRLARCCDRIGDAHEDLMRRLLTPVAKFWVCKRGSHFAQEAMECLGGNGYVEEQGEGVMARIYREMPLNSIWEGAGNIMALDLLRALRGGDTLDALAAELQGARGARSDFDAFADRLLQRLADGVDEADARRAAQDVALVLQAALLRQHAPDFVWEAFCASRLSADGAGAFGMLDAGCDLDGLIARAMPG
jgi:putative acyl-CoA dehydrogenase